MQSTTGKDLAKDEYRRSDSQRSEPYTEPPLAGAGRSAAMSPAGTNSVPPTPQEENDRRAVRVLSSAAPSAYNGSASAIPQAPVTTASAAQTPIGNAAGPTTFGVNPDGVEAFSAAGKPLGEVVVELRGVTKQYRMHGSDTEVISALKCINLCDGVPNSFAPVRRGEFVMIRGPSGGGKTTLLNMIGTIDCPTDGMIKILGTAVDSKSDDDFLSDLRLKHIGFVFQTFNLIPTMSALENVELPMTLLGDLSDKERKSRAKQLLALVGLRNRIHHLPSELSGGEQQRVTIARALANNPAVLLLDEPTGDLDTATTIDVMDLLLNINNLAGTTMIMVTHNPDVECYADRILYVSDGQFAQQVINAAPCPLVLPEYEAYLKRTEAQNTTLALNAHNARSVGTTLEPPTTAAHPLTAAAADSALTPRTPLFATAAAAGANREERPVHHDEEHPVGETNSLL